MSDNTSRLESISYFFPAHNEEAHVEPIVSAALEFLPQVAQKFEIIVVNDGSRDRTREIAERLAAEHPEVKVVNHEVNRGYGGALQSGIRTSLYRWVFFTDGDQQFDIRELPRLIAAIREDTSAVLGFRIKRRDPFHRKLNAWLYKQLIVLLFGLRVKDIDCAFKLMDGELVRSLPLKSNGALISAEMLIRMKKRGARFQQVGVNHYPRTAGEQSGANLKVILRMFRELFALAGELKREDRAG